MYTYTANVGSGLQGFQGKVQGWGGGEKHTHTPLHLAHDTKHTVQNPRRASFTLLLIQVGSREDRRGSKKVEVSTTDQHSTKALSTA